MSRTFDPHRFATPERGIRFIRAERQRRNIIAGALAFIAVLVTLAALYLSYRDVPAPEHPGNATRELPEPYR